MMNAQLRQAISMRDLQKMSAKQIEALPHPVPITSDGRAIALLQPFREPTAASADRIAELESTFRRFDENLTPGQKEEIAKLLAEIEGT
jgi:antitoxin (DNA-binding transcriptional repressor) of toxin-antitoxin stability system